jgi:hypothetical protein
LWSGDVNFFYSDDLYELRADAAHHKPQCPKISAVAFEKISDTTDIHGLVAAWWDTTVGFADGKILSNSGGMIITTLRSPCNRVQDQQVRVQQSRVVPEANQVGGIF